MVLHAELRTSVFRLVFWYSAEIRRTDMLLTFIDLSNLFPIITG